MKDINKNITRPYKGLHTDNSLQDQPKDTHRYGLNGLRESQEGDENFNSNEESNEVCADFGQGFIPIGKEYIGNGQSAVFLTNPAAQIKDIIAILDDECNYTVMVNANLGFSVEKQIDATYRLRRGCERTIYFTDDLSKPRIYNFDKPEDFKDSNGNWDVDKFNLFKTYDTIPTFDNVEITEGGQLPSGSYNFSIQYLDEDLNPTEWVTTTDTVIIFNDNFTSKPFSQIRGSTNKKTAYQDFGITNKAIKLSIGTLDTSFPFYRIAVIEANNGSGQVSRVVFSQEISTRIQTYTYGGDNAFLIGTEQEILQFNNIIEKAKHIEQIENRLILSNTQGKQIDFCKLQNYASKITSDLTTETIRLNDINVENNQKRSQLHLEKVGYMPGEIYSFGIVYIFEDGTTSPAYHIPGKVTGFNSNMSSDNTLTDTFYTDNNNCSGNDYWGKDSQGNDLLNNLVRHHRFPLRSEINKPLITKINNNTGETSIVNNALDINFTGNINNFNEPTLTYAVTYSINGTQTTIQKTINIDTYDGQIVNNERIVTTLDTLIFIQVQELDPVDSTFKAPFSGIQYTENIVPLDSTSSTIEDAEYYAEIFGINFANIDRPSLEDTNGEKVVGYYIVRNERTEANKTILDTGVIAPLLEEVGDTTGETKFVSHGHIFPDAPTRIKDDTFALIHPEHRFNNREYNNTTELIKEGEYVLNADTPQNIGQQTLQDVQPGTSYDSSAHKRRERDSDGFSFHVLNRNNNVDYVKTTDSLLNNDNIEEVFYLDALFSKSVDDIDGERKDVYNLSADNKIGILKVNERIDLQEKLPYVVMKRNLENPYSGFRILPYYKETTNYSLFTTETNNQTQIFNGDSYISSMKYMSSMFYDIRLKERAEKSGILNFIIGALSVIAGAFLVITGVGAAAGIALIGFGVSQISTGIKVDQIARVYQDLYEQGLKDTVEDNLTDSIFGPNPNDDTVQWFFESITNLWFESSVNMNWRVGSTVGITDFLNSPTGYDEQYYLQYCIDKTTTPDAEADDGRTYQGFAKAEIYEVNDDYKRRDKQKIFSHLGLEYDCCSDCLEDFPHRNHFSEQSFQEELTDNYRTFLPNNYRDMEGETGEITNIFRIQNNLYIHTEEALWLLPQNIQERITGDIVSFIGTGSFFNIPPRLIVDGENGNSAGSQHKWSNVKTPSGVFFVSENQRVIYQFDGNQLKPISSNGMYNWFKNNIELQEDKRYYIENGIDFPFKDNTSNPEGTGFISVYDSRKERIIFTKKDFVMQDNVKLNNSWTLSYSLKSNPNAWQYWHSYLPSFYLHTPNKFYSWIPENSSIWRHNRLNHYQNFYGKRYPFIVEYVSINNPLTTKIWDYLTLMTEAKKFNPDFNDYVDERFITFNKALFYNSRQSSGILNLMVKDNLSDENYLLEQVKDLEGDTIVIDRNERDWSINELRDIRVDYTQPMFDKKLSSLQTDYFTDKIVNTNAIDYNKDWTQLESFRDKYLVVRLIFDKFDDIKLLLNYSVESEKESLR